MRTRKTIRVSDLRLKANDMLSLSACSLEKREGVIALLTSVLHETGNYRGFGYLDSTQVPDGHKPGINNLPKGKDWATVTMSEKFDNTDNTRVIYY